MQFTLIDTNSIVTIAPYLQRAQVPLCDFTPATIFMWAEFYNFSYAIEEDILFICGRSIYDETATVFFPPFGAIEDGIIMLYRHCLQNNIPLLLSPISDEMLPLLDKLGTTRLQILEGWADYIYNTSDFATLSGHKYNSKRNHVNKFVSKYKYELKDLDDQVYRDILDFLDKNTPSDNDVHLYEHNATIKLLNNRSNFDLICSALYVDNVVVGFSLAERFLDCLVVHTEKASRNYEGVYETLAHKFTERHGQNSIFLNREEDMNFEGLRRAKESWHPIKLLNKYNVYLQLNEEQ